MEDILAVHVNSCVDSTITTRCTAIDRRRIRIRFAQQCFEVSARFLSEFKSQFILKLPTIRHFQNLSFADASCSISYEIKGKVSLLLHN
jgi:hypothetical protein